MPTIMQFESGIVNVWTVKRSGLGFFYDGTHYNIYLLHEHRMLIVLDGWWLG